MMRKRVRDIIILLALSIFIAFCASAVMPRVQHEKTPPAGKDSLPPAARVDSTWKDPLDVAIERAAARTGSILAPEIKQLKAQQQQAIADLLETIECLKKLQVAADSVNGTKVDSGYRSPPDSVRSRVKIY